jgi:phospholipase C
MIKHFVAAAALVAIAACGRTAVSPFDGAYPERVTLSLSKGDANTKTPIKHVVFIVQENRSFNNLFMGYPGATTATYGYDTKRQKIELQPIVLQTQWDLPHSLGAFVQSCHGRGKLRGTDCRMDGWSKEAAFGASVPPDPAYGYVPRSETAPYWAMAKQYVLADRMFQSQLDGSFVAHQYIVAAYADHTVDLPSAQWGCEGGKSDTVATLTAQREVGPSIETCFDIPSIATEADAAGVSWRFYAMGVNEGGGMWSSYQAESRIYDHPDWKNDVISPPSQFITDVGKGKLADVTWITPSYPDSDHAGVMSKGGPAWVASLVDAVGASKFWKNTAIFVTWDDWGGWFDPVKPVYEDYDGLGFRVPLLIISPYAKQGSVTHVQYETSSVLRFMEDNFGLAQLAPSDKRANDPANDPAVFDFTQKPRAFKKISGSKPAAYWVQVDRSTPVAAHIDGDD